MKDQDIAIAKEKFIRISSRKIARLARECVGQKVGALRAVLSFYPQKAARVLLKAIVSAEANLKRKFGESQEVVVRSISVNKGPSVKRLLFRARGKADRKESKSSHIHVEVGLVKKKGSTVVSSESSSNKG